MSEQFNLFQEKPAVDDTARQLNRMGLGGELGNLVIRATGETVGWGWAWRAVQHLVCSRPWLNPKKANLLPRDWFKDEIEYKALEYLLERSGLTLKTLIAEIDRVQPV
ncbi:MAG: hypothetical protein ACLQFW_15925 [Xanthobacteraceae bacterium]